MWVWATLAVSWKIWSHRTLVLRGFQRWRPSCQQPPGLNSTCVNQSSSGHVGIGEHVWSKGPPYKAIVIKKRSSRSVRGGRTQTDVRLFVINQKLRQKQRSRCGLSAIPQADKTAWSHLRKNRFELSLAVSDVEINRWEFRKYDRYDTKLEIVSALHARWSLKTRWGDGYTLELSCGSTLVRCKHC